MKLWRYVMLYLLLIVICVSQVVMVLGRSGQNVHASEQLSYLQKSKMQLQHDINVHIAKQARLSAISVLSSSGETLADYQPITATLVAKTSGTNTISLNAGQR